MAGSWSSAEDWACTAADDAEEEEVEEEEVADEEGRVEGRAELKLWEADGAEEEEWEAVLLGPVGWSPEVLSEEGGGIEITP